MINFIRLANLSGLLNVQKHTLREWIKVLEPLSSRKVKERSASEFNTTDLFFFKIVKILNNDIGIKIELISNFSKELYSIINNINSIEEDRTIWIFKTGGRVWKISDEPKSGVLCFSIPLGKISMEISSSLGVIDVRKHPLVKPDKNKNNLFVYKNN